MTTPSAAPDPQAVSYPPAPWTLRGTGEITAWRLPARDLPPLPAGVRPVTLRGRALVATAFVDYSEAGLMAYRELLAAVLVRGSEGLGLTITEIWVDSPASRAGGREMWGIPKELASFTAAAPGTTGAVVGGSVVARASYSPRRAPALRLPLPLKGHVVQTRLDTDGPGLPGLVSTPVSAGGRVRLARASWTFDPRGPLGWLASAKPLLSTTADDFTMTFG